MNRRHVLHVFKKDGLEILRDRRTLFVNIGLPLLLYPLFLLFAIQILQLTKTQKAETPAVLLVDTPPEVAEAITKAAADTTKTGKNTSKPSSEVDKDAAAQSSGPATMVDETRPGIKLAEASQAQQDGFREAARSALRLETEREKSEHDDVPLAQTSLEERRRLRQETLAHLRALGLVAVVVQVPGEDGRPRLVVLQDDASRRSDDAEDILRRALRARQDTLVKNRLAEAGLPENALKPFEVAYAHMAPPVESIRTRISGVLPVLLVLLAVSGAFFPALDLIAGERERGTLESLLSWPARRRDVFTGKLLVACAAAAASVILNICSLGATIAIGGSQIHVAGVDFGGLFSVGGGALAMCFIVLMPLTITLAAVALAVTGLANSSKEAQNYLTPYFLAVFVAAVPALIPGTRPGFLLDLIPVTGPLLALKESLQSEHIPWAHLLLSTGASLALAAVVVGWSARLLEDEKFRYPGLVRAGWGRFRAWGKAPSTPGGLEAMAVYAVAVAGFTLGAGHFQDFNSFALVVVPLLAFTLVPALAHCWLGAYDPRETLRLRAPAPRAYGGAALLVPFAVMLSVAISMLQAPYFANLHDGGADEKIQKIVTAVDALGGLPLVILGMAVLPGICEELLCRGTLLSGLERGIGRTGAVIISAFLFGALHADPSRFLPQFALGMVLAILVIRTRSIIPSMIVHAGHNATVLVIELKGNALAANPTIGAIGDWLTNHLIVTIPCLVVIGVAGLACGVILAGRSLPTAEVPADLQPRAPGTSAPLPIQRI